MDTAWNDRLDRSVAYGVSSLSLGQLLRAAAWTGVLALATIGMLAVRPRLNEAHVALVYLLVVLGASAYAGRRLGLALAAAAFLLFDWYFLPPYGSLVVVNPLDWIVLFAFLGTSAVATQLLSRAQEKAQDAQARAAEIDRLAVLGAESLKAGRADEAMPAIADVIRSTLDVDWCEVYVRDPDSGGIHLAARAPERDATVENRPIGEGGLVHWVDEHAAEAAILGDGTSRVAATDGAELRALFVPLQVRERVVGVLGIGEEGTFSLTAARRRVLRALSYYAALGVERARLARDVEHAEALREADRLKDALLASVSHDLRTPLTTIKALANAIAASGDDRAVTIEEEADRLNRFVENLLDLSRIQAGGRTVPTTPNEAEDLIGAALQRVAGRATGREICTKIVADENSLLIGRFDFTDTLRALVNILENALKYSPPSGPVELTAWRDDAYLVFAVADRGPGIPPGERERIFQPFNRPTGLSPDVGGAGLGLSIARSLAVAQGGSLTYEGRDGGGSVFTLRVPALDASDPGDV